MNCPNCQNILEERQHKLLKDKMLKQPYFYLRWYKCFYCKKQYNFEKDKIFNNTKEYLKVRQQKEYLPTLSMLLDEEINSHLKNL